MAHSATPDFSLEESINGTIAAIDEVGRGPWAGPVVAVATIIPCDNLPPGITDSKQLSRLQRERLYTSFMTMHERGTLYYAVGWQQAPEIDRYNILGATHRAMQQAFTTLQQCAPAPIDHILVDGNRLPDLPVPATPVVKGDSRSLSIATASIIAKVIRDRHMQQLAHTYPHYGWERNAGYGTKLHQEGLQRYGITPEHRRSFRPIQAFLPTAQELAHA